MPVFEYKCNDCEKEFERLVRSTNQVIECPVCKSADCIKQFSVFGFDTGNGFVSSGGGHECRGCHSHNCEGCK